MRMRRKRVPEGEERAREENGNAGPGLLRSCLVSSAFRAAGPRLTDCGLDMYLSLWKMLRATLLCCLLGAFGFLSAGAEEPVDSHSHAGVRLDKNMVQDKEHIMEHLEGVIEKSESEMSPQELQLHYFKMHDYDGNNLLDGLELATAISHVHKEEGGEQAPAMKEEELMNLIDDVLKDDDKNNDGYIDYAEFAKSLE